MNTKELAERATIQSFLNCYLRETGNYSDGIRYKDQPLLSGKTGKIIVSSLAKQHIELIIPVKYWSLTDRHLFDFPIFYHTGDHEELKPIDYITLTALIVKELLLVKNSEEAEDELLLRVILSCRSIKSYIENRVNDTDALTDEDFDYIEAEQSLLLGHMLHPTPKSKQGLTENEDQLYAPELKGEFQLHYFSVEKSLITQDSSKAVSASSIIFKELGQDSAVDQTRLKELANDRIFIPVHPLQVKTLLEKEEVQSLLAENRMEYLGPLGKLFTATSSFRTVYSRESKYMYKFSVPVKITNSLRINQQKELARGVEVTRLLETEVGQHLAQQFPGFKVIQDPAYLNVRLKEEISGFEVVIRDNPFYENSAQTSLIAGLCQDHAFGGNNRLHSIIRGIAIRENRKVDDVSLDWFNQYLSLTLDPMIWLFHTYGIALEAHQQNSLIQLEDGYPKTFYYRDNQGYYYSESHVEKLKALLPDLNQKSDTICADHVAEERLRYYFFFNHLFGLINGFGASGLIAEERLIDALRHRLELHEQEFEGDSDLLNSLLYQPALPCKANLLTRFHDMDELVGPMEAQSVYTMVKNPLVKEVEIQHVI
ncbi:IucA/IucC family siderophore biosynthesis protein [Jeotgalibacillus sp. S-D1]|uniref:IucA/IucC family protein n=1 Tax=Jeotgalibacillus sp. S-D1 TaxID=2552189 RepID=UPI00105A0976|nr:IucA/IucC family protein [Jeotgalibacillus sp. S-D1]TDL34184.1 IucA/IucC family siderophore biosynthesis protein [Jeotgalibacillus sp. S-D1]